MRVTIHQPNFFPHLALFEKMESCDVFVILTECQWEKNGYQNRFIMDGKWHTMSTNKGLEPIKDKRYINHIEDWNKIKINTKADILHSFDDCISDNLVRTNTEIISRLARILNIGTKIVIDYPTKLKGTERLVDICQRYKAKTYVSGSSGKKYMDLNLWNVADINVEFQESKESKPIIQCIK